MDFPFLSLSLSSLCCVIYPRGRSSVHSSKRVTTGPNGLQRVRTGPVPTGSNGFEGGGGEEMSMTRLFQYFNNIIYIIYLKKILFLFIFLLSLCNNPPFENIYIKKNFYSYSYMFIYLFIYNIKIQKLIVTKKFHLQPSIYFLYLYYYY